MFRSFKKNVWLPAILLATDGLAAGLRLSYGQDLSERKIDTATAVPDYHYYSLAPEACSHPGYDRA